MKQLFLLLAMALGMVSAWAVDLPITDIALFSSGVGYFQRSGVVHDTAAIELAFKPEQINDLLKSMILLDLDGGTVGSVTYGTKDPVSKTLESFAVNITDNPTLGQLLNRLRGVRLEIQATNTFTGVLVGVETRTKVIKEEVITYDVLNMLTETGLRAVPLDEITSIRILDERLNRELNEALAVIATGLDNQRKPVVVTFTGTGERHVIIGYLNETPVWKTSYRLVLADDKKDKALLQGWAIVENTSDADWSNVRLSLISGRPISFIEDLYTPLYIPRPVIEAQRIASMGPVQYGANFNMELDGQMPTSQPSPTGKDGPGAPGTYGTTGRPGGAYPGWGEATRTSIISAATASNLGEAFQYAIKDPVTLPRQKSALLPIITGDVDAWKVSIYNADIQSKFPLYGLRIKNTTGLHLMGGPITVYQNNIYAGDATFEDLQPGEQRLISYAMDLGVAGERNEDAQQQEVLSIKIVKGQLSITRKFLRTVNYSFVVKDGKDRKLIVNHPFRNGWKLVTPEKEDERTDTLYRFNIPLSAKDGAMLKVVEEHIDLEAIALTSIDTPTIFEYIKTGKVSPKVRNAMQKIADMQTKLRDMINQRQLRENEIVTIGQEQNRLRQNMNSLDRNSDLYKRYVTILGEQETRIETLRKEIEDLLKQEQVQRKAIEEYVAELNLE